MVLNGITADTASTAGIGQSTGRPQPPDANQMLANLTAQLNLSDTQNEQIKSIMDKYMSQQNGNSASKDGKDMQGKMDQMNQDIKSVLNSDQQVKFDSMIDEMKSKAKAGHHHHNGQKKGPNADDMTKKLTDYLGLSDTQSTQLKQLLSDYFANNGSSSTQNGSSQSQNGNGSINDIIKSVLNSDQTQKFENLINN